MAGKVVKLEPPLPEDGRALVLGMHLTPADVAALPVEKLEQLFGLHQRVEADKAKQSFNAAFAEMQPKIPATVRHGQIKHGDKLQSTYAKYEDIIGDIAPVLAEHGFSLRHRTKNEPGKVIITGILAHRDGHAEETTLELPADTSGSKNAVQAIGSSVQYGKRYTASALLNLVSRGEDDDGQAAGASTPAAADGNEPISDAQIQELVNLCDEVGADKARFCKFLEIGSLSEILVCQFDKAKQKLEAKRKK